MRALITGVTGQDGSYLAELLLEKGYEVYGVVRNIARESHAVAAAPEYKVTLLEADLIDQTSLDRALQQVKPDEVYNLAGQSHVPVSWSQPLLTMEACGMGALRVLEAMRRYAPKAKFLQASSSEMFGSADHGPLTELSRLRPRNPYGAAKLFAHHMTINYRESYGLFACSCIAFNHESPRRGSEYVTRKVSRQVARIRMGLANKLELGNLEVSRDWGFAGDYVRAMWLMLQQSQPDDFVIATGELHTVKELVKIAFRHVGLDWRRFVEVDPALARPVENDPLVGDPARAAIELGWKPTVTFEKLICMMVDSDLATLSNSATKSVAALAGD